ncbi:hypothetical protein NN561_019207 [Cricetulus griseus]
MFHNDLVAPLGEREGKSQVCPPKAELGCDAPNSAKDGCEDPDGPLFLFPPHPRGRSSHPSRQPPQPKKLTEGSCRARLLPAVAPGWRLLY